MYITWIYGELRKLHSNFSVRHRYHRVQSLGQCHFWWMQGLLFLRNWVVQILLKPVYTF